MMATIEKTRTSAKTRKKDAAAAPARRRGGGVQPALIARVDLLPPSVELRRRQSATLRLLGLGLAGLLLISVTGSFAVSFLAGSAEQRLADEQARSVQLVEEQQQYTEVQAITAQLADYESAEFSALFAETDWPRLMRELDAALPAGVVLSSEAVTIKGLSTSSDTPVDEIGLDALGVIEITFSATADVFESSSPLLGALQSLTGYSSATVNAVSGGGEDGYVITGVVHLNAAALGGTERGGRLDPEKLTALRQALETAVTAPPAPAETTDETADDAAATQE